LERLDDAMATYLIEHSRPVLMDLLRSGVWLVIIAAIFVPLERLFALHRQKIFRKEAAVDVGYYFLNGLTIAFVLAIPLSIVAMVARHVIPGSLVAAIGGWPLWVRACAAMVVGEIGYYWGHRLTHQIPFLWRFHAVHHSAEQLDFLVSSRGHPVDVVFTRMCMLTPLLAFGLVNTVRASDGLIPVVVLLFGMIWGFFIHSNLRWRLGPLEWLIATPGFHHWHHTNDRRQRDCNYSTMLPWIDRIFGTHYLPRVWPERYGIDEPMADSLAGQLIQPLQASRATLSVEAKRASPAVTAPAIAGVADGGPPRPRPQGSPERATGAAG
jgi:sterol desaturase/sphingolipid hydroxylase (fatty acid hydroxylase superfamily)